MKKNISLVCLNDFIRKEVGKALASSLKMLFCDIDEMIDFEIINKKQVSIKCGDEYLKQLERECIERVMQYETCVYSVSDELFMANNNSILLEDTIVVYLETQIHEMDIKQVKNKNEKAKLLQKLEIQENINNYLKINCPYIIENADRKTIEDIVKEIKNFQKK